jgi:SAM-dependent methyltransferase
VALNAQREDFRAGITVPEGVSGVVDVVVGGRRIWSFNAERDADVDRFVAWPSALAARWHGDVHWQLVDHATGTRHAEGAARLDDSGEEFQLVDGSGQPLAIDKSGHLTRMFDEADGTTRGVIVDAVVEVLEQVRQTGTDAFLAFGCLLGAVRDGRMIGHDNDADVAVLCGGDAPVDVTLQSYRLQHALERHGWQTRRMSAGDFKVYVKAPDGTPVGIDLFSAWYDEDGLFTLLPNVRGDLPRDSIFPLGTIRLEGREVTAPRDPEPLLALTYGPGWAVPDPSFTYEVPHEVKRRMNGWFRGERNLLDEWNKRYISDEPLPQERSDFAAWVLPQLTQGADLLDLGCGHGRDTVFFAQQQVTVTGYDYSLYARRRADAAAARAGVSATVLPLNFQDHRDVLTTGSRLAFRRRARDVYSRLLLDDLTDANRAMFWRFCSMVQRRGGRCFVEVRLGEDGADELDRLVAQVERQGGTVEHASAETGRAVHGDDDPLVGRLVVTWTTTYEGER